MSPELDPQTWSRARDLFLDLAELEDAQRAAELGRLRADDPKLAALVEGLLGHDPGPEPALETGGPERFGPYRAVRLLGTGGMGEVFLARRDDGEFEREVAVKLLRPGAGSGDLATRFVRERQTLAALEHESIVRLLDGGTADDGRPYIVMEYVEGVPLDAYVREHAPALRARLELFRRVLDAVAHAHGRGVVHRDLKPSNVLVRPDGAVRLVDFGIARVLDAGGDDRAALTRTGQRMFTPEYASPEQIRGERTSPATDVFALGVMLYELVAGQSPWNRRASSRDLEEEILDASPPPPSRRAAAGTTRGVRRDLDTLCLKCLDRAPERRYADAAALAEDLDRHLTGRTILARRATALERGVRLVRRRPWQAAAVAAVFALLGALAWGTWSKRVDAARQASLAAALPGRFATAQLLLHEGQLEAGRDALESAFADVEALDDPRPVEAFAFAARAALANSSGEFDQALEVVRRGRPTVDATPASAAARAALRAEFSYLEANAFAALGRMEEAEAAARDGLVLAEEGLAPEHHVRTGMTAVLARVLVHTGRHAEALALLAPLRIDALPEASETDPALARIHVLAGRAHLGAGDAGAAVPLLEGALESLRWHHGEGHKDVAEVAAHLGQAYLVAGRHGDAARTLAGPRRAYRELDDLTNRAFVLDLASKAALAGGETEAAIECMQENLEALVRGFPATRVQWCAVQYQLGWVLCGEKRLDEARAALEAALAVEAPDATTSIAALGPGAEGPARATLGDVLDALGEDAAALEQYRRAAELFESAGPQGAPIAARLRSMVRARERD